jgi:hypothetical protein
MHDWLGIGLVALGLGLIGSAIMKRQSRMRNPVPAGAIRPEFAAMGEMVRPIILFAVAFFALKMTVFYFVLGGQRYLTPLDYAGILFVLAAYCGWLVVATTKRPVAAAAPARDPIPSGERSAA